MPTFDDLKKAKLTPEIVQFGVDTVYEALLAVGAAHRASLLSCSRTNVREVARLKVLGLRAYGRALPLLGGSMQQNITTDPGALVVVLLLCTYFEVSTSQILLLKRRM